MSERRILWEIDSRYACVTCISTENNVCVVEKKILPNLEGGFDIGFINKTSMYFREKLLDLGVPLAEPYLCFEKDGYSIQESPYVGPDLEQIFKRGNAKNDLLDGLIRSIHGVLFQDEPTVGIDARLSNFCLGSNGVIYYVDTFPPLVKYGSEFLVHFPNPTDPDILSQELKRKFDPMGILRRLRFSILEQDVGFTEEDILKSIKLVLGIEFYEKARDFFNTFPDHMKIEDALKQISLSDPDGIRELALNLKPKKGTGQTDFFRQIFDLSSNFCPGNLSKKERMSRIKKLLKN